MMMMGWEMVYIQCHEQKKYVINGKQFLYTTSISFLKRKVNLDIYFLGKKI